MFRNNKGFTLIELMVSLGVLAVISAALMSRIGPGPQQYARDTRRQSDLNTIASALALYRNDLGGYPLTTASLIPNYITAPVPTDPRDGSAYTYTPGPPGCAGTNPPRCTTFTICDTMEKTGANVCVSNP
ncbi:hypothetical protein A2397_05935 [Candidatus Amesbacteria bacterium RIFOXYB1_FULL_44_23]|uniref:Type II secretion system protein GspG C-terminal domain-containing protein n=1 Tax=Candidatus Amesbacteria bacterium RIFOXYB1_FULL_44_23 TaxID=1797263 RepID=A0A1F4ZST6_9BACT|nr:MAG: hypothetical protein A2397_05935 [Candidatus Amesbacteria bacterium RIFOXYB1_FULL_44_23]